MSHGKVEQIKEILTGSIPHSDCFRSFKINDQSPWRDVRNKMIRWILRNTKKMIARLFVVL
jgi:hypothetical protein